MIELKLCPFCGGDAEIIVFRWNEGGVPSYGRSCAVRCTTRTCGMQTGMCGHPEEAAAIWNRRADDPLKERVCETLKSIMPEECYAGEARTAADCDGCELRDGCDRYVALKALAEWQGEAGE